MCLGGTGHRLRDHSSLILRYDLVALAEHNKLNPLELIEFARSPAVQAHLAGLRTFADQAFATTHHSLPLAQFIPDTS